MQVSNSRVQKKKKKRCLNIRIIVFWYTAASFSLAFCLLCAHARAGAISKELALLKNEPAFPLLCKLILYVCKGNRSPRAQTWQNTLPFFKLYFLCWERIFIFKQNYSAAQNSHKQQLQGKRQACVLLPFSCYELGLNLFIAMKSTSLFSCNTHVAVKWRWKTLHQDGHALLLLAKPLLVLDQLLYGAGKEPILFGWAVSEFAMGKTLNGSSTWHRHCVRRKRPRSQSYSCIVCLDWIFLVYISNGFLSCFSPWQLLLLCCE